MFCVTKGGITIFPKVREGMLYRIWPGELSLKFSFTPIACVVYIPCTEFGLYMSDSPGRWLLPDEALLILRLIKHSAIIDLCVT